MSSGFPDHPADPAAEKPGRRAFCPGTLARRKRRPRNRLSTVRKLEWSGRYVHRLVSTAIPTDGFTRAAYAATAIRRRWAATC